MRLVRLREMPEKSFRDAEFGWCRQSLRWLFPVYNAQKSLIDLRSWNEKSHIYGTAGRKVGLWGIDQAHQAYTIWICEGEWDAIILRHITQNLSIEDTGVVAVPGADTLKKEWLSWFTDKEVVLAYDHDGAGERGESKAWRNLKGLARLIWCVRWPNLHELSLTPGWDIRAYYIAVAHNKPYYSECVKDFWRQLQNLRENSPRCVPAEEITSTITQQKSKADPQTDYVESYDEAKILGRDLSWAELIEKWKTWVELTSELEDALRIILAITLTSTTAGEPIWLYLVGPPGCGKTLLLSPLRNLPPVVFRSSLTSKSLLSGWGGITGQDPSLIPRLNHRTLIVKDLTELLSMHPVEQDAVFSILRGAYDGTLDRNFGNNLYRKYDSHFNFIAAVTNTIHGHSHAAMGERCLRFQFSPLLADVQGIIQEAIRGVFQDKEREQALRLWTWRFLAAKHAEIKPTKSLHYKLSAYHERKLIALVRLVAKLRSQVERSMRTDEVLYRPVEEIGTRLAKQVCKLMYALSLITGPRTDHQNWRLIEKIALDTAIGLHVSIVQIIYDTRRPGYSLEEITEKIKLPPSTVFRRLNDMKLLGLVDRIDVGSKPKYLWVLEKSIRELWKEADIQMEIPKPLYIRKFKTLTAERQKKETNKFLGRRDSS